MFTVAPDEIISVRRGRNLNVMMHRIRVMATTEPENPSGIIGNNENTDN